MTTNNPGTQPNWVQRLITPPRFEDDADKTRAARFLNIIVLVMIPGLILYVVADIVLKTSGSDVALIGLAILISMWVAMRRGWIKAATLLLTIPWIVLVTAVLFRQGTIRAPIASLYMVPIIMAALLIGRRTAILITGVILAILLGLTAAQINGQLPAPDNTVTYVQFLTYGLAFVSVAALLFLWSQLFNEAFQKLELDERSLQAQNARLTQLQATLEERVAQRTEQLRASSEVGRAATLVLETDQLLREVVNLITTRFGYYYAAIFLTDPSGKWAVLREATGEAGRLLKERGHRLEMSSHSMVGTAMKTQRPRIALDVGAEAVRFANPLLPDTRSEIALPLVVGNRVIGALDVQSTAAEAFDESSAIVLQAMADQIAVALSNTIQFQQTQMALQIARRQNEASFAVTQAGDAASLLSALVDHVGSDADRAAILLYGPEDAFGRLSYVEVSAGWTRQSMDAPLAAGTWYAVDQFPYLESIKSSAEPLIIGDTAGADVDPAYRSALSAWNARALLGLNLTVGSQSLGMLLFAFGQPRHFTDVELDLIKALTRQAVVVLRNRQLVDEAQAALKQVDEINRRLTGEAWEEYSPVGQVLRKVNWRQNLATGETLATAADLTRVASMATAPVIVNGAEVGVVRLEDPTTQRTWSTDDVALLEAIASEVSVAIEKARLIEETEKRARRERAINRITGRIRNAASIDQMLSIAAQELRSETQATRGVAEIATEANPKSGNGHEDNQVVSGSFNGG